MVALARALNMKPEHLKYYETAGGNANFEGEHRRLPGRYGNIHVRSDMRVHLDTANPNQIPFGTLIHFFVDVIYGNMGGYPIRRR